MTAALGLVCLTTTDEVRFRTITRTRLRSLDPKARAHVRLGYEEADRCVHYRKDL